MLVLSDFSARYLLKHFTQISSAEFDQLGNGITQQEVDIALNEIGSKFHFSFAKGPYSLVSILNNTIPISSIHQSNGRVAYIYKFTTTIGTTGIIEIKSLPKSEWPQLTKKNRGNYEAWVYSSNTKIETDEIVLVAEGLNVIICFPGPYAPPFPNANMNQNDFNKATLFWDEYAFIENEK